MNGRERGAKCRGRLFVLAGPSGVGKGTLRARVLSDIDNLVYSISCTTRAPREGEREGVDYRFISKEEFMNRERQNLFLEHAAVHGNFYGTLREDVEREMEAGHDVLLEIDVQGARQIRELLPESVLIFIAPPSAAVLEERLRRRRTESEEQIALRLENAKKEMEQSSDYSHVVLNDTLERASEALRGIVLSYRNETDECQ
ncbi:MAG: guanylate kinase [Synergistaceae bacterium]|jgi:guanylate kinase|nr:guanylate kinase [Synergistaceae bacterium]